MMKPLRVLGCCLLLLQLPVAAQIGSCVCRCKQNTQRCFPSFPQFCNTTICAQSACGAPEAVQSASWMNGGCPVATHPGNYDSLVINVKHSIAHQGARIWKGPDSDQVQTGDTLRANVLAPESNDPIHHADQAQAQREISAASIDELENATIDALRTCVRETPGTFTHFEWVAKHERKWKDIEGAVQHKDFDGVRSIFSNTQAHDDRIRNTLYCYSGPEINQFFQRLGAFRPEYGPLPPPVHEHIRDHPTRD
jgi:hypothetical protein